MTTLFDMFDNIKTQTYNQINNNIIYFGYRVGYSLVSFISYIEIMFTNSVVHKCISSLFNSMNPKFIFQFIKDGKQIQTQYECYKYYLDDSKFDFIIFSNGINNRIIKNINQHICFNKDPNDILISPVFTTPWFSSTLQYSVMDNDTNILSIPIEFNNSQYNYLLHENIFDNLFIEYFIQTYYNINLQNNMYSISILNTNFKIDIYNRNKLINLQNILKKEM